MPDLSSVNWLAVLVAAIAYFALGAVWYGPLFGKKWAAGMGLDMENASAEPVGFVATFVAELGLAAALAALLAFAGVTELAAALQSAFWLWLGLVATTATVNAAWDPRPWTVFAINQGQHLVAMLVAAAILTLWP